MSGIEVNHAGPVLDIVLNRPEKSNAFDMPLIEALTQAIHEGAQNKKVRCIVLQGKGKHFSAGGDLAWMQSQVNYSEAENKADADKLATLMSTLAHCPCPTIALVHGAAMGGGAGLVACCDIALASEDAMFSFSEARIGLVPATIAPYVIAAIGPQAAKRLFLTAEHIKAPQALNIGLISHICRTDDYTKASQHLVQSVCANSPQALNTIKQMMQTLKTLPSDAVQAYTADLIAQIRVSEEGQEGLKAFLEKRKPGWLNV